MRSLETVPTVGLETGSLLSRGRLGERTKSERCSGIIFHAEGRAPTSTFSFLGAHAKFGRAKHILPSGRRSVARAYFSVARA